MVFLFTFFAGIYCIIAKANGALPEADCIICNFFL